MGDKEIGPKGERYHDGNRRKRLEIVALRKMVPEWQERYTERLVEQIHCSVEW